MLLRSADRAAASSAVEQIAERTARRVRAPRRPTQPVAAAPARRYPWRPRRRGGVATQRPAKPSTPVRFRSSPLVLPANGPVFVWTTPVGFRNGAESRLHRLASELLLCRRCRPYARRLADIPTIVYELALRSLDQQERAPAVRAHWARELCPARPVSEINVDCSFVMNMDQDEDDATIALDDPSQAQPGPRRRCRRRRERAGVGSPARPRLHRRAGLLAQPPGATRGPRRLAPAGAASQPEEIRSGGAVRRVAHTSSRRWSGRSAPGPCGRHQTRGQPWGRRGRG